MNAPVIAVKYAACNVVFQNLDEANVLKSTDRVYSTTQILSNGKTNGPVSIAHMIKTDEGTLTEMAPGGWSYIGASSSVVFPTVTSAVVRSTGLYRDEETDEEHPDGVTAMCIEEMQITAAGKFITYRIYAAKNGPLDLVQNMPSRQLVGGTMLIKAV